VAWPVALQIAAALAEIAGCSSFRAWLRLGGAAVILVADARRG
jgi:drug/metabolite transporter superfamily protein YnfA